MYLSFGADSWAASKMTEESLRPFTGKKMKNTTLGRDPVREAERASESRRERGREGMNS